MQSKNVDDLIKRWAGAENELARAKASVNSAECELTNATNALGKLLCPPGCLDGDEFSIWINDAMMTGKDKLIVAKYLRSGDYSVKWYRPAQKGGE